MTEKDFYKLSYEDMMDCLIKLKIKYNLASLSKKKLYELADSFMCGFRPNSLKAYIFAINKYESDKIDAEEETLREKHKDWLEWWGRHKWLSTDNRKEIKNGKRDN